MPKKETAKEKPVKEVQGASVNQTDQAAAAAEAKAKKSASQVFKFTGNEPSIKLAPQAQGIVNILREAGEEGLTRAQLAEAMKGIINTKQPESRILSYYQKKLMESGAVVIEDPASSAE